MNASLQDLKKELWLRSRSFITWTTKEGTKIPIKDLSTEHLINIINMLEEKELYETIVGDCLGDDWKG